MGQDFIVPVAGTDQVVNGGSQWSVGLDGTYGAFGFGAVWTQLDSDGDASASEGLIGMTGGWEAFTVGGWYAQIFDASGAAESRDGDQAYGLTAAYDLGGGAQVAGGVAQTFGSAADQEETVADFGIKMAF